MADLSKSHYQNLTLVLADGRRIRTNIPAQINEGNAVRHVEVTPLCPCPKAWNGATAMSEPCRHLNARVLTQDHIYTLYCPDCDVQMGEVRQRLDGEVPAPQGGTRG